MKIVIDIPNSLYANLKKIQNGSIACKRILELVRNGTPYEERPQGEERVNIKMSEEEIKQFKQMLREHNLLYSTTSNTFVEGASVERQQGEWIKDGEFYRCSECSSQELYPENFCYCCGADMRGKDNE